MEGTGGGQVELVAPPEGEATVWPVVAGPDAPDRPGVVRRLLWWIVGPLSTAALLTLSLVMVLAPPRHYPEPEPADLLAVWLTLVLAATLLFRRRWALEMTAVSTAALVVLSTRQYPLTILVLAPAVCAASAVYRCAPRRALLAVLAASVGLGSLVVVGGYRGSDVAAILVVAASVIVVAAVFRLVRLAFDDRRRRRRDPGSAEAGPWYRAQPAPVAGWPTTWVGWAVTGSMTLAVVVVVTASVAPVLGSPAFLSADEVVLARMPGLRGATGAATAEDGSVYAVGRVDSAAEADDRVQVVRFDPGHELRWEQAVDAGSSSGLPVAAARLAVASGGVGDGSPLDQIAVAWLQVYDDDESSPVADPSAPAATVEVLDEDGARRWSDGFGTGGSVFLMSAPVALPDGGFAVAGAVNQSLDEQPLRGPSDAFVRSYRADGSVRWTRQFGSDDRDGVVALAADAAGNLYAAGGSLGSMEPGASGAFLAKVDVDGAIVWTRQFGVDASDLAIDVATDDHGSVFVIWGVADGFGSQRNTITAFAAADGARRWDHEHGVNGTGIDQVTVSNGRVFASGCLPRTYLGASVGAPQGVVVEIVDGRDVSSREIGGPGGAACIRILEPGAAGRLLVGGLMTDASSAPWVYLAEIDPG